MAAACGSYDTGVVEQENIRNVTYSFTRALVGLLGLPITTTSPWVSVLTEDFPCAFELRKSTCTFGIEFGEGGGMSPIRLGAKTSVRCGGTCEEE